MRGYLHVTILFGFGCASAAKQTAAVGPQPACVVPGTAASLPGPIKVSTLGPPFSSRPALIDKTAERFAMAQLYETLISIDCEHRLYAGLARSWAFDATKTRVTLTLRDDAHFWGGDKLRAADVVDAWRASGEWSTLARRIAAATTVIDERTLLVSLPDTQASVLAHPDLRIHRRRDSMLEGTSRFRPKEDTGAVSVMSSTPSVPSIVFDQRPRGDARDAIDARTDLILDPDPIALNYAATRSDFTTVALPWSRTYVLAMSTLGPGTTSDNPTFRATLATDVVRTDARPAEQPVWWDSSDGCPMLDAVPPARPSGQPRIVYRTDDNIARAIAERIVAVSSIRFTAFGLGGEAFDEAMRTGADFAYVFPLPRRSIARCTDLVALRTRIPWAAIGTLIPLIDTRDRVIVRTGAVPATIDWDGTLRIGPP